MCYILLYICIIYFARTILTYFMDFLGIGVRLLNFRTKDNNFNWYIKRKSYKVFDLMQLLLFLN